MLFKGLVGEDPRGAHLHQVAAEFTFQRTVLMAAEINGVMRGEDIKVPSPSVVPIKPDAAVTLYTAVHLVIHEGPQILVHVRPLAEAKSAVDMASHDRHVLKVAFTALITHGTVMGMICHQPLDVAGAEFSSFRIIDGQACTISGRCHAGHDYPPAPVFFIPKYFYGTLTAGPHGMQGRVPAKMGYIEAQRQAGMEEILSVSDLIRFVIYVNSGQQSPPGALSFFDVTHKIVTEIFQGALERLHSTRS